MSKHRYHTISLRRHFITNLYRRPILSSHRTGKPCQCIRNNILRRLKTSSLRYMAAILYRKLNIQERHRSNCILELRPRLTARIKKNGVWR